MLEIRHLEPSMAIRGRFTALRMTTESLSDASGLKNYLRASKQQTNTSHPLTL